MLHNPHFASPQLNPSHLPAAALCSPSNHHCRRRIGRSLSHFLCPAAQGDNSDDSALRRSRRTITIATCAHLWLLWKRIIFHRSQSEKNWTERSQSRYKEQNGKKRNSLSMPLKLWHIPTTQSINGGDGWKSEGNWWRSTEGAEELRIGLTKSHKFSLWPTLLHINITRRRGELESHRTL